MEYGPIYYIRVSPYRTHSIGIVFFPTIISSTFFPFALLFLFHKRYICTHIRILLFLTWIQEIARVPSCRYLRKEIIKNGNEMRKTENEERGERKERRLLASIDSKRPLYKYIWGLLQRRPHLYANTLFEFNHRHKGVKSLLVAAIQHVIITTESFSFFFSLSLYENIYDSAFCVWRQHKKEG